jgi:hypothetical protein
MTVMQTVNKEKLSWITFAARPEARSFAPVEMDVHQVYYGRHTSYIGVAQGGSATSVCLASIVRLYRTAVRRAPFVLHVVGLRCATLRAPSLFEQYSPTIVTLSTRPAS